MAVVVAVLVLAWVLSRRIALVVSGLLLLTGLGFSAWVSGGWINVAGIVVMAVVAVLGFAWARSRSKPPPGPDGAQREEGPPAATAPPGDRGEPCGETRPVLQCLNCASEYGLSLLTWGPGVGLGDAQVSQQRRTVEHGHGHPERVSIPALGESVATEGRVSYDSLAERTSRRRGSWIEFDVAATPAAPPPATSQPGRDGAANGIVVSTSMMAAASTHRYIVVDLGSGYPARRIPAHLDPLLHVGSPYYLARREPLLS